MGKEEEKRKEQKKRKRAWKMKSLVDVRVKGNSTFHSLVKLSRTEICTRFHRAGLMG